MPDHKFRQHVDRNYVLLDAKQRIIDLMENGQELPEVGIYDEPVRYFKANEQWCKIIFGWLDWLEDVAGWHDAEDDNYSGIQQILIFEEGIDPMSIDYEALQAAIKAGMYDMVNDVAKQIVSGRTKNISVDEEGAVSDPSEGGTSDVDIPADDPATAINESESAIYGGVVNLFETLEAFYLKLDNYYGSTNGTPTTPESDAVFNITAIYPCNDLGMAAAVGNYYLYRNSNGKLNVSINNTVHQYAYCRGYGKAAWSQWVAEISGYAQAKKTQVLGLSDALMPEFWTSYFEAGTRVPSTGYLAASCVKMASQTLTNVAYTTVGIPLQPSPAKGGHRVKVTISGYYVDPDGDIQDAQWYRSNAGVLTRSTFELNHGAGNQQPSASEVPYTTANNHTYVYTVDLADVSSSWELKFPRNGNMNVSSTSPTSGFTITIEDLGQWVPL